MRLSSPARPAAGQRRADLAVEAGRDGQVEDRPLARRPGAASAPPRPRRVVASAGDIVEARRQNRVQTASSTGLGPRVAGSRAPGSTKSSRRQLGARRRQDLEALRQEAVGVEEIERRQQHAPRQVAGRRRTARSRRPAASRPCGVWAIGRHLDAWNGSAHSADCCTERQGRAGRSERCESARAGIEGARLRVLR